MNFQPFAFMAWAKSHSAAGGHSLARSGMPPPPPELLGLDELPLTLAEVDSYGPRSVVERLAARHALDPGEVFLCGGSASQALFLTGMCLLEPGDLVLAEQPGYEALHRMAQLFQARVEPLARPHSLARAVDEEALAEGLERGARMVLLTNLHNPTGAQLGVVELQRIAEACTRAGARLVVDEVFAEFLPPAGRPPSAHQAHPEAVTLSSFTKAFGVGSLRAGWILAPPGLARRLEQANDLLQVVNPTLPFLVLERILEREARLRAWLDRELLPIRSAVTSLQAHPDLSFLPPAGGTTLFAAVADTPETGPLCAFLAQEHRVHVVPGAFFGEADRIRVGLSLPTHERTAALAALVEGLACWRARDREQPSN